MKIEINEADYLLLQVAIELQRKMINKKLNESSISGSVNVSDLHLLFDGLTNLSLKLTEQRTAQEKKIRKVVKQ